MRLAGHTYTFRDRPLGAALRALRRLGFDAVELWVGHAGAGPVAALEEVRRLGLDVVAVSAGRITRATLGRAEEAVALAEALGAPVVAACVDASILDSVARPEADGVTICLENHWYLPLAGAREVVAALERAPGAGACLDTGHALLAGEDPVWSAEQLGSRLRHVHLKEAVRPGLLERSLGRRLRRRLLAPPGPAFPGEGGLDVAALRRSLEGIEYGGAVTAEFEGGDGERALAELVRRWKAGGADRAAPPGLAD